MQTITNSSFTTSQMGVLPTSLPLHRSESGLKDMQGVDPNSLKWIHKWKEDTEAFFAEAIKERRMQPLKKQESTVRKRKGVLGSGTQNNLPRNKRRVSKRDFSALLRKKRQSCVLSDIRSSSRCVATGDGPSYQEATTYCKDGLFCKNFFDFTFHGQTRRWDAAHFECVLDPSTGCYTNPSVDFICRKVDYFSVGEVNNPCSCHGYTHPCTSTEPTPMPTASNTEAVSTSPTTTSNLAVKTTSIMEPTRTVSLSASGDQEEESSQAITTLRHSLKPMTIETSRTLSTSSFPTQTPIQPKDHCSDRPFYYAIDLSSGFSNWKQ